MLFMKIIHITDIYFFGDTCICKFLSESRCKITVIYKLVFHLVMIFCASTEICLFDGLHHTQECGTMASSIMMEGNQAVRNSQSSAVCCRPSHRGNRTTMVSGFWASMLTDWAKGSPSPSRYLYYFIIVLAQWKEILSA